MNIKKEPLISIIIPTYNVEQYLLECLNSIEKQTYTNFECIIIIDGSTDNSYNIAKEFSNTHPRFKVFYQENAGSGPARNNGIKHSSGEFICFIDPDDWVENNYIESLITEQEKGDFDLVMSQSTNINININDEVVSTIPNKKPIISYIGKNNCRENFPNIMFKYHYLDGPICKLFKTSIIKANKIKFPAYRRSQDMVFNFRYYHHINTISSIKYYTYNIRREYPLRPGRGKIFTDYNKIIARIYKELSEQLKDWNINTNYNILFHSWIFGFLYFYINRNVINKLSYEYIEEEPYTTIINQARPTLFGQKIIRILLVHKMYKMANILIRIINKIKDLKFNYSSKINFNQ